MNLLDVIEAELIAIDPQTAGTRAKAERIVAAIERAKTRPTPADAKARRSVKTPNGLVGELLCVRASGKAKVKLPGSGAIVNHSVEHLEVVDV